MSQARVSLIKSFNGHKMVCNVMEFHSGCQGDRITLRKVD
jgi:hypothetical protein